LGAGVAWQGGGRLTPLPCPESAPTQVGKYPKKGVIFPLKFPGERADQPLGSFPPNSMKALTAYSLLFFLSLVPRLSAEVKEPPVPVRTFAPEYPTEMARARVSGVVTVKCTIDAQGNVTATEVLKFSLAVFEQPALDALQKWKFKPATIDGVAVAIKAVIPVLFVAPE
jgi:protein TonB